MNLYKQILEEIVLSYNNNYENNYDYHRFGRQPSKNKSFKYKIKTYIIDQLKRRNFVRINAKENLKHFAELQKWKDYDLALQSFYELLSDDNSKKLLVKILSYRILGHKKIVLHNNLKQYWNSLKKIESITDFENNIPIRFMNWSLKFIDLNKIGIPIKLYFTPPGAHKDFILKQYEYCNENVLIKALPGDYVIDAGACWGDTALYFANEVGIEGRVFSFEFIPSNIELFKKNLNLSFIVHIPCLYIVVHIKQNKVRPLIIRARLLSFFSTLILQK